MNMKYLAACPFCKKRFISKVSLDIVDKKLDKHLKEGCYPDKNIFGKGGFSNALFNLDYYQAAKQRGLI